MKQKTWGTVLGCVAVACVLLGILRASFSYAFSTIVAFPFEQIGLGLRALSLPGGAGNAVALVFYAAISLLPVGAMLLIRTKRKLRGEDWLLGLLSPVLFAVLYYMVNPNLFGAWPGDAAGQSATKAMLGVTFYSVLCGYLVLRLIRLFSSGSTEKLEKYMTILLRLLSVLFVYLAFGPGFSSLLDSIAALQAGNVGNEHLLGMSYVFLVLQFLLNALPYVLDILVIFAALRLLEERRIDRYSDASIATTERMAKLCVRALTITVLANIGLNLLQLIFSKSLMVLNSTVQLPIFSIAFVLAALLLTRLVGENKQLKDDNDMFV